MDLQEMQNMAFIPANGQIWLRTPPVVLQRILVLYSSTLWSAIASSRKALVLILSLGE